MAVASWRMRLQPASYNGVPFKVDVSSRAGGRRVALHEFPKKDLPYAEDMGRKARRFTVNAYIIDTSQRHGGTNYTAVRDALITELEKDDAPNGGVLILPTGLSNSINVTVESYSVTERRERGGVCEFEITFIETGKDISGLSESDTAAATNSSADTAVGDFDPATAKTNDVAGSFIGSSDITGLA